MAKRGTYQGAHFAPQAEERPRKDRTRHKPARSKKPLVVILVIALLAAAAGGAVFFWRHRPVSITVDGVTQTAFKRTTLDQLFHSAEPNVQPGDLVSVTGNVIEPGAGNAYSVSINGVAVPYEEVKTRFIWGGEHIAFGDGEDTMEDYTVESVEVQPKFEFQAVPGIGEKGQLQLGTVQYVKQWGKVGTQELRHGTQTGESAPGAWIEEPQNLIVVAQDIKPDNNEKLVALTFDDGPTYYTAQYLDILAERQVPATFCVVGEQVGDGAQVISDTAAKGHQIASCTWSHQLLTTLDQDGVRQELGNTAAALKDVLGKDVMYVRPPFGDMDEQAWLKTGGCMTVSFSWTHDARDWEQPGVTAIVANSTDPMRSGSIILMHDGGGDRSQDLEALPRIIAAWQSSGYRFVTVEELLASDSSISLDAVQAGPMPADAVWPTEMV